MTNGEKFKSAKERAEAFDEYAIGKCTLNEIHADNYLETAFAWLDLEAPAEKPLPCPFCGGRICVTEESVFNIVEKHWLCECLCGYSTKGYDDAESAIAAHNRVARAVEKEANDANS